MRRGNNTVWQKDVGLLNQDANPNTKCENITAVKDVSGAEPIIVSLDYADFVSVN